MGIASNMIPRSHALPWIFHILRSKVHGVPLVEAKCQRGYCGTIVRLCGNHTVSTA